MTQGTYHELNSTGFDMVSLMKSDEDLCPGALEPDKPSIRSRNTTHSHGSLLQPDSSADELPVGVVSKGVFC